jgi:hypothetical protein
VDSLGLGEPSLEELLAGPAADPGRAEPAAPEPPVAIPEPTRVVEPVEPEPVVEEIAPITDLCYSGDAALERAASLASQIRAGLATGPISSELHDLVEEVLDLVELGRSK